jgi:hypothetical protein
MDPLLSTTPLFSAMASTTEAALIRLANTFDRGQGFGFLKKTERLPYQTLERIYGLGKRGRRRLAAERDVFF